MGDREETDRENQRRENNAAEPLPPAIALPAPNAEQPHGENVHAEPNHNPQESEPWFRKPDWWMVILTAVTIVVAVVTLRIFYLQFGEMQTQTGILHGQAEQAARDSIEAGRKVDEQLAIARQQASASQDSVQAITHQMRQDQRAWLVITYEQATLKDGAPIGQLFYYTNKGKTPAKRISAQFIMRIVHDSDDPAFDYPDKVVTRSRINVLFPPLREGVGILLYGKYPETVVYGNDIKRQFLNGDIAFMVYGEIEYDDIFKAHHWVHYCTFTAATIPTSRPLVGKKCSEYNDTDDK
jgi:hypothetical protein